MEALAAAIEERQESISDIRWTNADNKEYADKLALGDFLHFLEISGLSDDSDVKLISEHILNSESILEVGGGFGRVIKACRQLGYDKKLSTIEYAHSYANFLKEHIDNCEIIEDDFLTYPFKKQFDLVLMMWTTISIFSPAEQRECLKKCAELLNSGGYVVIDLMIFNNSSEAKTSEPKEFEFKDPKTGADCHAYIPTTFEIIRAAAFAGLAVRQVREYVAGTAARCLVILGKS